MHRLQEVVRLHRQGESSRRIARMLRMGRDTIRQYVKTLRAAGLLEGSPDDLPDTASLQAAVAGRTSEARVVRPSTVERWRGKIAALVEKGAGPTPIHDFLRLHEPDYDGSLSAVKRMCARLKKEQGPRQEDVAIRVETEPGEVAQVDFKYAGKIYDPKRGVPRKAWIFGMTLSFSRRMYLDIVFDQKIEAWLELHVRAFKHFGGVPRVIVPDNLKSAVIRCAFGIDEGPTLNRSYRELARFYGFEIDPTPPRSPEKKGKVERSLLYVGTSFLATWESVDINEDRKGLRRWNEEIADVRTHGTTGRRPVDLFDEHERAALVPLPEHHWEPIVWKKAKLHRDSHVQVDAAFYSAPWRHIGQELWVRCTRHEVAIYAEEECLHRHQRAPRGQRKTIDAHLPETRRDLRHRTRGYWINKARLIGPEVVHHVEEIFGADDVLLQLRRVQAVVTHLGTFPVMRARRAAARALHYRCLDYRSIKGILRRGLDLLPLPEQTERA